MDLICPKQHTFPWNYSTVSFADGVLVCPSCGTDLQRLWTLRELS